MIIDHNEYVEALKNVLIILGSHYEEVVVGPAAAYIKSILNIPLDDEYENDYLEEAHRYINTASEEGD